MLLVGAGLLLLYVFFPRITQGQAKAQTPAQASAAARGVPVVTGRARAGDMAVYLTGLGTATALNTVTVRSRVDGQLVHVAFREGQIVSQGDLLAELDPRPYQLQLTQAQGLAAKDEANVKNAQLDLQRYQDLWAKSLIPKQQLDTQLTLVTQDIGALASDQGQIDAAKLNLVYCRITSPITGRVGLRLVDEGNIVHATDVNGLVVITQLDPIAVVFTIPEDNLPEVLQQMDRGVRLPVDAYDRGLTTKLAAGELFTTDNAIDTTTGTIKLKALFPNKNDALFPNQFVNARLLVDTIRGIVQTGRTSVSELLVWMDLQAEDQVRTVELPPPEDDEDAVEIMTIHGAKGLEFPLVVVAELGGRPSGRGRTADRAADGRGRLRDPREQGAPDPRLRRPRRARAAPRARRAAPALLRGGDPGARPPRRGAPPLAGRHAWRRLAGAAPPRGECPVARVVAPGRRAAGAPGAGPAPSAP